MCNFYFKFSLLETLRRYQPQDTDFVWYMRPQSKCWLKCQWLLKDVYSSCHRGDKEQIIISLWRMKISDFLPYWIIYFSNYSGNDKFLFQESLEKNEFQGVEHKLLPNWLKECQACLGFHAAACLEHNQKRVNRMSNAVCDGWFYRVYIPISCS